MASSRAILRTALVAATLALAPTGGAAQSLPDPILPGGHLRVSALGDFTSWSQGYGEGFDGGAPIDDAVLLPGLTTLEDALAGLTSGGISRLTIGASGALVSRSTIQVPLSLEVGVLDWLTVGAAIPLRLTRVEAELDPGPGATLGTNPALSDPGAVLGFLGTLSQRGSDADALAQLRCGEAPGSAGCQEAQAASEVLFAAQETLRRAYGATALFPAAGSPGATALEEWAAQLDADLAGLGLDALGSLPPVAAAPLDLATYRELTGIGAPLSGTPLNPRQSLWSPGDLAVTTSVRVLDRVSGVDSAGVPGLRISAALSGTLRLPTGGPDSLDIFNEAGLSEGQRDLEIGGWLGLSTRRLAVRARGSFNRQEAGTFETRRNAAAAALGAPPVRVRVDPGDEVHFEIEPAFRLAPALSLGGVWRYLSRGAGATTVSSLVTSVEGAPTTVPVEPTPVLPALGTLRLPEWSIQEVGLALTYRTVDLGPGDGPGFEAFLRIVRAVGGDQGVAPRHTRATMGLRLTRRIWGS